MTIPAFILPVQPLAPRRQPTRRVCPRRRAPRAPRATLIRAGSPPSAAEVEAFAEAIRGEWPGYEGTFDVQTGRATPVPDYYIPEQFAEWGLVPHGFESNHSITVRGTTLYRKFFRVLPAVSLFADHVDLEEDLSALDIAAEPALHVFPDGAFAAGPSPVCVAKTSALQKWPRVELCLRDPRDDRRVALHVHCSFDFEKRQLVREIRAVREQYSCIYCDGADIEGSSGYVEGWVIGPAGAPDALRGEWRVVGGSEERVITREAGAPESPAKQLYLPDGVDVGVTDDENGGLVVHAGWLVDDATRVVMRRGFAADGSVRYSERLVEHRV